MERDITSAPENQVEKTTPWQEYAIDRTLGFLQIPE